VRRVAFAILPIVALLMFILIILTKTKRTKYTILFFLPIFVCVFNTHILNTKTQENIHLLFISISERQWGGMLGNEDIEIIKTPPKLYSNRSIMLQTNKKRFA
jgi:hypothetical protein